MCVLYATARAGRLSAHRPTQVRRLCTTGTMCGGLPSGARRARVRRVARTAERTPAPTLPTSQWPDRRACVTGCHGPQPLESAGPSCTWAPAPATDLRVSRPARPWPPGTISSRPVWPMRSDGYWRLRFVEGISRHASLCATAGTPARWPRRCAAARPALCTSSNRFSGRPRRPFCRRRLMQSGRGRTCAPPCAGALPRCSPTLPPAACAHIVAPPSATQRWRESVRRARGVFLFHGDPLPGSRGALPVAQRRDGGPQSWQQPPCRHPHFLRRKLGPRRWGRTRAPRPDCPPPRQRRGLGRLGWRRLPRRPLRAQSGSCSRVAAAQPPRCLR